MSDIRVLALFDGIFAKFSYNVLHGSTSYHSERFHEKNLEQFPPCKTMAFEAMSLEITALSE